MFFKIKDTFCDFLMLFYGLAFCLTGQEFTDFLEFWGIWQGVKVLEM